MTAFMFIKLSHFLLTGKFIMRLLLSQQMTMRAKLIEL